MTIEHLLPYGRHSVDEDDIAAVVGVLRSDWLTTGPKVREFEEAFAKRVGARYGVACSSGTAALHLAALALGLRDGDAVIVPTITFLATANAARYVGAEVVFADVDSETGLIGLAEFAAALERAGSARVKAFFPVHLNGQCVDMELVAGVAAKYGLTVVEDACHALGCTYRTRNGETKIVGSCAHSEMAVFSFHPAKTITMGEGGIVTTNDGVLHERLKRYRNHGMVYDSVAFENRDLAFENAETPNPWYYEMQEPGYNYRASDINCALGLSQLSKLDRFVQTRFEHAQLYDNALRPLAPLVRPIARANYCNPAWHLYVVLVDFDSAGIPRAELIRRMQALGIITQVHYIPLHKQPYYSSVYGTMTLPGADAYYSRCLSLPLFPAMAAGDVNRVVDALTAALGS